MGKYTLVALDTDHIKQYVFATNKLKEIRGASSLLDYLNRRIMDEIALKPEFAAEKVYANGGSGLFLIQGDRLLARKFGQRVQQAYRQRTFGGASITFVVQELPDCDGDIWQEDLSAPLELLRFRLAERKLSWLLTREDTEAGQTYPDEIVALPSHPLLRTCDACGVRYAEDRDKSEPASEAAERRLYCSVCLKKRKEDVDIKEGIDELVEMRGHKNAQISGGKRVPFAWQEVFKALPSEYPIPAGTERPGDFNEFRGMSGSGNKDYLALIYMDGNNMGQLLETLPTLAQIREVAGVIDEAIYKSIGYAIGQHLPVLPRKGETPPRFPFDLLMVGGDDMVMVTPAAQALDVSVALAKRFYERTRSVDPDGKHCSVAIGVVLAPVKYPFALLHDLAEETLQYAKKEGAKRALEADLAKKGSRPTQTENYGKTLINFMTVTGSTSQDFGMIYKALRRDGRSEEGKFYATLRPYTLEEMELLLTEIRKGHRLGLGRTKLHQVREAVLKMNLRTSVHEGIAVLRNWRSKQREFVFGHVYKLSRLYQERYQNVEEPGTLFPRVTFPWFADGPDKTYRTSLLDYVELYDFVAQEGAADEN